MAHMSIRNSMPARTLFAFSALAVLALPAGALAAKTPVHLRVVDSAGKTLSQQDVRTGTVEIKTDPEASCFGEGTGGTGDTVTVSGPTALGAVQTASESNSKVRPLSVTNAFDFGLGLCGIGKAVAPATGFWYLKVNHVASQAGGDQTTVAKGDNVLWWLDSDFSDPPPAELELKVPKARQPGEVTVKVFEYSDDGTKTRAEGADVRGASDPTDAAGKTTLELGKGKTKVQAIREGAIPSNIVTACVGSRQKCS